MRRTRRRRRRGPPAPPTSGKRRGRSAQGGGKGEGGRAGGGKDGRDPPVRVGKPVRETPQGQEATVPRGDRPPEQADPEGCVLDEGVRSGDSRAPDAAAGDLQEREQSHADQEEDRDPVLDAGGPRRRGPVPRGRKIGGPLQRSGPPLFPAPFEARYSSRNFFTASKASAGMIFPRIRGWISSTIFRHWACTSGGTWWILRPFFTITSVASRFRRRISTRSFRPAARDASSSLGRSAAGIFPQARISITVAPVKGTHRRSAMCGPRPNHWKARDASGVLLNPFTIPVCRLGGRSVVER